MESLYQREQQRQELQSRLDSEKTLVERNRLGQFATPSILANDLLCYAKKSLSQSAQVRFLDPAIGTGAFYSAFLHVFGRQSGFHSVGFEIDNHYGDAARELWGDCGIDIHEEDFTQATPPQDDAAKATLVICNPPYVRHHHLTGKQKKSLHAMVSERHGILLSGLSGLYCYFLCLSKDWMATGGLAAWLIPSEFMDVNYGSAVKEFLLNKVTLLHIHRFSPEDVQFEDALVSSAVVWFRNSPPDSGHRVKFSFGGSLCKPSREKKYSIEALRNERKWTKFPTMTSVTNNRNGNDDNGSQTARYVIGDFFDTKRGIATGANKFFILSPSEARSRSISSEFLRPILPSPRYLQSDRIESDQDGTPTIEKCGLLFSSDMPESYIEKRHPKVWAYLEEGRQHGISERYICRNRKPWYSQENREVAPFLCTYMGRTNGKRGGRPFRFILNRSRAIAANVYLMLYPKPWVKTAIQKTPELAEAIWRVFQSIPVEDLLAEGRVYGGGLYKLEPKELLNAPVDNLAVLFSDGVKTSTEQLSLF